jgi:putative peptidoglycan binding protein
MSAALRSRTNTMRVRPHGTVHIAHSVHRSAHGSLSAHSHKSSKPRFRGQQAIDSVRTLEIQQALIRAHYLSGEPTGQWDQATRDALVRLQDDNHWQTKVIPDSRALIKLGLGPSPQNLLNPESAAIAVAVPGDTGN